MTRKSRKISINYRLLQTSCDIEVVGSVPSKQVYQADYDVYTPDYTLTPLTLFPRCNATDPQAVKKIGVVNALLTNMSWYERYGDTKTLIESTNTDYTIVYSGNAKGQITVRKNVMTTHPLTLEFEAEYVDARTGQVFSFSMSHLVSCTDGTAALPVITIDSPSTREWNPVREPESLQTIKARVMVGNEDVTETGKCRIFFYRKNTETGALTEITDGNGVNDWEFVSKTKSAYTLDRNYIGDEITIICRCSYSAEGNPAESPDASSPEASTVIRRRIPRLECDWAGVPNNVADGTAVIRPIAIVKDSMGVIDLPEEMFRFYWNVKKKGTTSYTRVADIKNPIIPFSDGMMLELEVEDRGAYCLVMSGGKVVCSDGKPVFVRKNGG